MTCRAAAALLVNEAGQLAGRRTSRLAGDVAWIVAVAVPLADSSVPLLDNVLDLGITGHLTPNAHSNRLGEMGGRHGWQAAFDAVVPLPVLVESLDIALRHLRL